MILLPPGVSVEQGDKVTLSAPQAWATVKNDFAEAMEEQPIEVCTGRSFVGTDAMDRTLKAGVNYGHLATPFWSTYALPKNLARRILRWFSGVVGADKDWVPTKLSEDSVEADFISTGNKNGLDNTGVPIPEGLYAVGWGRSSPVECAITSPDAVVTERADMANPGDANGQGLVRVFDVRRKRGAASATFTLRLKLTDRTRARDSPTW